MSLWAIWRKGRLLPNKGISSIYNKVGALIRMVHSLYGASIYLELNIICALSFICVKWAPCKIYQKAYWYVNSSTFLQAHCKFKHLELLMFCYKSAQILRPGFAAGWIQEKIYRYRKVTYTTVEIDSKPMSIRIRNSLGSQHLCQYHI